MTSKLSRVFVAVLALAPAIASAVPNMVNFSARVADNGRPVTGSHEFKFEFWDCDGTDTTTCFAPDHVIWTEIQTLTVNDGVATAVLGEDMTTPNLFPPVLFNGSNRWLAVTMDGTAFGPFMGVKSVPYAIRAGTADNTPRLASATRSTSMGLTGTCSNYLAVSITVPGSGYVLVEGLVRAEMYHATATYDYIYAYVSNSPGICGSFSESAVGYAYSNIQPGWIEFNLPNRHVFTVGGAGTYTYYLNGSYPYIAPSSTASFITGNLTATYFP